MCISEAYVCKCRVGSIFVMHMLNILVARSLSKTLNDRQLKGICKCFVRKDYMADGNDGPYKILNIHLLQTTAEKYSIDLRTLQILFVSHVFSGSPLLLHPSVPKMILSILGYIYRLRKSNYPNSLF